MTFDLKTYLKDRKTEIEAIMSHRIDQFSGTLASGRLVQAMRYSLMAGGKRLRPILCLASAEAVGGMSEMAVDAAVALEMIHTYSLIHDDLPAMDNDDLRRGNPTCHIRFDEATAILAGDALLTEAFHIMSAGPVKHAAPESALLWLEVINLISDAAGCRGMIEGQMRDILSEQKKLSLDELERVHNLKTGALIEASVVSGALLGGADPDQVSCLKEYAKNIGLAFQVADDILNVEGDPELMGKSVGTDEALDKATYPSLLGIEKSKKMAGDFVEKALLALEDFDNRVDPLRSVARYIIERKR